MADKRRNRRSCRYYEMPGKCSHESCDGTCENAVRCQYFDKLSVDEKAERKASMVCVGRKVTHWKFGNGKISLLEDKYVTVAFDDWGEKKFQYPDAIGIYLILA